MDRRKKTIELIIEQGILPQYFHPDPEVSVKILKALYQAGIRVIEYTNQGEIAVNNFLQLRKVVDSELPGLELGVGNIRNTIDATEYANEGASFMICPYIVEAVADLADKNDLLWIPACLSATEISVADDLGARVIKLFPVGSLGPDYVTAMKQVFPELLFLAMDGVEPNETDLESWFKAGAGAVGLGSKLIGTNLMETKDYGLIESLTKQSLQMLQKVRAH